MRSMNTNRPPTLALGPIVVVALCSGRGSSCGSARKRHRSPRQRTGGSQAGRGGALPSTAAGRAPTRRRAAPRWCSTSRRSRAGPDQKHMVAYAAVSYTPKGAAKPALGTVKVESDTQRRAGRAARELLGAQDRRVQLLRRCQRDQLRTLVAEIAAAVPLDERVIALDRVLANIDTSQIIPKNVEGVKADPPPIFFSKTPAVLVNIDGDPIWSPIKDNDLKFAVNTNWDLFQHAPTKTFYLRNDDVWLKAADAEGAVDAGRHAARRASTSCPPTTNWKDVKASAARASRSAPSEVPQGVRQHEAGRDDSAARASRATSPVQGAPSCCGSATPRATCSAWAEPARSTSSSPAAGSRRRTSPGPWTFATPTLPADFKKIPLEHARSRVLASVPGTPQAAEAVLLAQIPQTATRQQRRCKAPEVDVSGRRRSSSRSRRRRSQRAVNTDKDIIKVGDLYYMCFQGVWFMSTSADRPVGGHRRRCRRQIYEIPVSSPSYTVTYVTVQESNDDAVVFATAAAYTGVMVAWGCAVWGTGYYYPPYVGYGGVYPYLLPALSDLRLRRVVQPVDRRLHARRGGVRPVRRRRRRRSATTRGPAPTRAARWPTVRTARAARRRPTTRAPAPTARPGRARTSTAAGDSTGVQRGDQWASDAADAPTTPPA